jgi:glycosyltransferase involved in cell wall biosynthesis
VELAGEVPSVAACFASASAVIAPLLSGGGTKLKVLDAFAAGRAVVATSIGAAGIDAADGEHLLVADGATAFADACVRTLTDADLRESLARNGRALAEAEYDWRALGDRLAAALDAAARPDPVQHDQ